jgi:CheY-like chemotaxis protein
VTEGAAGTALRRATILLVEDDAHVASFVRTALGSAGHDVIVAANAEDAWGILGAWDDVAAASGASPAVASCRPCDLVLTDIVMPGMGGAELARRIANRTPRIPSILMSGYADDIEGLTADARPAAFLDKPFTVATLLAAVDRALAAGPDPGPA